jgi:hypothetical protein
MTNSEAGKWELETGNWNRRKRAIHCPIPISHFPFSNSYFLFTNFPFLAPSPCLIETEG